MCGEKFYRRNIKDKHIVKHHPNYTIKTSDSSDQIFDPIAKPIKPSKIKTFGAKNKNQTAKKRQKKLVAKKTKDRRKVKAKKPTDREKEPSREPLKSNDQDYNLKLEAPHQHVSFDKVHS